MRQFYRAVLLDDDHRLIGYLDTGAGLMTHAWIGHHLVQGVERLLTGPARVVWACRRMGSESLYAAAESVAPLRAPEHGCPGRFLVNHDRREYVDKAAAREHACRRRMHPLPVLTAEDSGAEHTLAGSWARDRLSVRDTVPPDFELLKFDLAQYGQSVNGGQSTSHAGHLDGVVIERPADVGQTVQERLGGAEPRRYLGE